MPRKDEYKPLLLTTTVRSPERYKLLLNILLKYNGVVLTNEIIDKVIFDMVANKLYMPIYALREQKLKIQLLNEDEPFSDVETKEIIDNSPQKHKEAGFDYGWASRFDTFFKFAMELGFIYYEMHKPIEFSETGLKLVKSIEPAFAHLEKQVFLNAFVKYQRVNPFRRIKNTNKPLILLLQTISEIKRITKDANAFISRLEIALILCWRNDSALSLANKIIEIRNKFGFVPSEDYLYEICVELLDIDMAKAETRFKKNNIFKEMIDEFIRKMRLTSLISIRGGGRFVDFNMLEIEKIKYVLSKYSSSWIKFKSPRNYFDYMKATDTNLISLESKEIINENEKDRLFIKWVNEFALDALKQELLILCNKNAHTKNNILKYISEPTRLEFLTAIALKKAFPDLNVSPNYIIDDEGLPTTFAPGGNADIVCKDEFGNILFEVTLLVGSQQNIREMPSIQRHLEDSVLICPNSFSVFLCPRAHSDTLSYSKWLKDCKNLVISVLEIAEFAKTFGALENAREYANTQFLINFSV
ncbi:MAG: AlwI family type II restriction endonuclease [Helicobacteraceae bacterium]|jgi:hypothetical protein|nr:AlwI family type II restriction endonuclease [Helicobacteraceae bacterium]